MLAALAHSMAAAERCVVLGDGRTVLDTCAWLLSKDVPAQAIRWIEPGDGWWPKPPPRRRKHRSGQVARLLMPTEN